MSTDLNKIRELWEKRNNKGQQGGNSGIYFTPPLGETEVRILPFLKGNGLFYKATGEHTIDGQRYYCPKLTNGSKCPICEEVNNLYNTKRDEDAAIAKQFKAKKKFLVNVIIRGREQEGPKVWGYGIKMNDKLFEYFCDKEYGDLTNIENGYDFVINRKEKDGYPNYDSSKARKNPSPLSEVKGQKEEWVKASHDLHALVDPYLKSYAELKAIFKGETVAQAEPDADDAPVAVKAAPAATTTKKVKEAKVPVEDADADEIMKMIKGMNKAQDDE